MKKYLYTLLVILILSGCSDSWMEIEPVGVKFESNFYQTEEEIYQGLIACYSILQPKYYSGWSSYYFLANFPSDDSEVVGGGKGDRPEYHEIAEFRTVATNSAVLQLWRRNYFGINRANAVLFNADPEASQKSKEYVAEAKFLRAYYYAELVRFFGDIPLIVKQLTPDEYNQARVPAKDVYAQIISDLTDAMPDLAEKKDLTSSDAWRATKGAAQALLGKVYLYMASPYYHQKYGFDQSSAELYGLAADQFRAIYESEAYELEPDYKYIWSMEKERGVESIFEIEYANIDRGGDWGNGRVNGGNIDVQMSGPRGISTDTLNSGWGFDMVTEDLIDLYNVEGDQMRLEGTAYGSAYLTSIGASGWEENEGYTGWFSWKRAPWKAATSTVDPIWNYETNERVIRYADVLLMYAEAMIGAGSGDPTVPFNEVRRRVEMTELGTVTLADIKKERRMELAMEGFRFFDLVRWGDAPAVLGDRGFVEGTHEVFPIPEEERSNSNYTLTQNNGY